jgi:hypothetical protein
LPDVSGVNSRDMSGAVRIPAIWVAIVADINLPIEDTR